MEILNSVNLLKMWLNSVNLLKMWLNSVNLLKMWLKMSSESKLFSGFYSAFSFHLLWVKTSDI